jgi:hypothetical protein
MNLRRLPHLALIAWLSLSGLTSLPIDAQPSPPGMHIAFAWLQVDANGTYWHNGGTGGYSRFVFFNAKEDYAAVVLVNRTVGPRGSLADLIGQHIGQRLTGKPAISLDAAPQ